MARRKKRKGWLLILLIILGVGLYLYWGNPFEMVQPAPVLTEEQIQEQGYATAAQLEQAIEQGNWNEVYDMLEPSLQRQKTREEFVANIAADEWFKNISIQSQMVFTSPTSAELYFSYGQEQFPVMLLNYRNNNWELTAFENYFTFDVRNDQKAREVLFAADKIVLSHFNVVGQAVAQAERSFIGSVGSTAYLYPCGMFVTEQSRVRVLLDSARSIPSTFPKTKEMISCYEKSVFPVFIELLEQEDAICARQQQVLDHWEQARIGEMVKLTTFYSALADECSSV